MVGQISREVRPKGRPQCSYTAHLQNREENEVEAQFRAIRA